MRQRKLVRYASLVQSPCERTSPNGTPFAPQRRVRRVPLLLALFLGVLSSTECSSRTYVAHSADESSASILQRRAERPRGSISRVQPRKPLSGSQSTAQQDETTSPEAVATAGSDDRASQSMAATSGTDDRVASAVPQSDDGATADPNSTGPLLQQSWWESHHFAPPRAWLSLGVLALGLACLVGLFAVRKVRR
jgi:hypothetical protein